MQHFVVYHKAERMGYGALDVNTLGIVTNKTTFAAEGARVWLIAGEGSPCQYKLRGTFIIDKAEPAKRADFGTSITGRDGRLFDPMPLLNGEEWFPAFRQSQGNFAFGFQPIKQLAAIEGLRRILRSRD